MRKKITMLFASLLACVGVAKAQTVVNDVALLTDDMECTVTTSTRGGWAVKADKSQFGSTNDYGFGTNVNAANDQHVFQFKTIEGKVYLYSLYAEKFVNKDRSLSETAKQAIEFIAMDGSNAGKFVVKFDNSSFINLGGSKQMIINGWGANAGNEYDDGNIVTITDVTETRPTLIRNELTSLVESAKSLVNTFGDVVFSELTALNDAIAAAEELLANEQATNAALSAQIAALSNAKATAEPYPFVEGLLKNIEPSKYFIYYTDENSVKHYLQTTGANSVITVTENPVSYDVQVGTTEDGKFSKAYLLKMNEQYISNTSLNATNIETKTAAQLWSSQVLFEKDGKCAIRLTNATAVDGWHGHYFINKGEENTAIGAEPSLGEALFIWTVELDLQGMREEMATLKTNAESKKAELEALPATAPVTGAIAALNNAIANAVENANSNDSEVLNWGITQLNEAIAMCKNLSFEGGALASLEDGEYVVFYEDANGDKHYLVNNKTTGRVVASSVAAVYDVYAGTTNGGYASYAYCLDMNESKISNPTNNDAKEIQVENKGGNNYGNNRVWDTQVLYVNADGKYAIRSTNCPAGSGWNSDCFITVSVDGATVSGQNTDLSDALYMWNVVKANEASIVYDMTIDNYKYMTLYLNYAANVPAGATAYAVSGVENGELTLTSVGNVIPENTPVIIEAEANDYSFTYAAPVAAYTEANMLKGTWFDSEIAPTSGCDAYVMALVDDRVVMGKATLNLANNTKFKNRANKAYLEIAQEVAAGAPMFSLERGEGTTSIEKIANDAELVIYDLAGRRVAKMEKGIYIVNGKKVVIK